MARTQTVVQLSEELVGQLDREAQRRGCSRSALIREAVVGHLAAGAEQVLVDRYVEGYRRIPQATTDAWGELASDQQRAQVELGRRLDAEDDAAGLTW